MSDRIMVGTRKGLFFIERRGSGRWSVTDPVFLGQPVSAVLHDRRDGSFYAALNLGHFGAKLHRSANGREWKEAAVPAFPLKPEDLDPKDDANPWTLKQIWIMEAGGDSQEGFLWAGTIPGGLFRSGDGGESWDLVESLWNMPERKRWFGGGAEDPGIHSIIIDARSQDQLFVGVSCGGVWMSADAGGTWEVRAEGMRAEYMPPDKARDPVIQDPHRVVQCASEPDVLWTQHHNGIFRSADSGRSWVEIENVKPSAFGFAVCVHPSDPDLAWFVPAVKDEVRVPVDGRVVVNRTADGGKTFETIREGLPQEHAYDLVYRHGMDVDQTGDRLVMGSTTGSLWVSEDQGSSWKPVAHHLPPVYCVRFAST
jgi:hypothetical protein